MKKTLWLLILSFLITMNGKSQEFTLKGTLIGVEDGTEIRINPYLANVLMEWFIDNFGELTQ